MEGLARTFVPIVLFLCFANGHAATGSGRELSFEDRVTCQRAIELVYWSHTTWPDANARPKPAYDEVVPLEVTRARVEKALRASAALETFWNTTLSGPKLQAEVERMARQTRRPGMLRELFAALGDDPARIAECLARPLLARRLARAAFSNDARLEDAAGGDFDAWLTALGDELPQPTVDTRYPYRAPALADPGCTPDTWSPLGAWSPDPLATPTAVWTGAEMIVWSSTGSRYDPATDTWTAVAGGPEPRTEHSAVWTGTEMIVWGGVGGPFYQVVNTGARYNPLTDTWTATSTAGDCPAGRTKHTAVWTGSEMIVWGGSHDGTYLDGGARYNPATDSWIAIPASGTVRAEHTAVWTGTEMIVWGGGYASGNQLGTGARYNPATNAWTPTSTLKQPPARHGHSAVWTGQLMIVWGGYTNLDFTVFDGGSRYDPVQDTWSVMTKAGAPAPRYAHTAVWSGTRMIVWGGQDRNLFFETGGRYDPNTDTWSSTSPDGAPTARAQHVSVWTGSEMIAWGGWRDSTGARVNTGGRYDPATDSWRPTSTGDPGLPEPRDGHTAVWTGTQMIVWGGSNASRALNTGGRFDPATATWSPTAVTSSTPSARAAHTAVWTGTQMVVWGGGSWPYLGDGARYDPFTDAWAPTSAAGAPSARSEHTAVWTGTRMIVWGGGTATGASYDPAADAWTPLADDAFTPSARRGHTAVWTGARMIVWGGYGVAGEDDWGDGLTTMKRDGGQYDPQRGAWFPLAMAGAPSARENHTAVWTGSEMLVWGGDDGYYGRTFDTGARYDVTSDTWTPISTGANVPSPRRHHTAVWTGDDMIVWGGTDSSHVPFADGARYRPDTDSWEPVASAGAPRGRYDHTAVHTGLFSAGMIAWGGLSPDTSSGAAYCAPCTARTWYEDRDRDGHGRPDATVDACTPPVGYSPLSDDCDDDDAARSPGSAEVCDGKDNDCNGLADDAVPPPLVSRLVLRSRTQLLWSDTRGADAYDVVRGDLGNLLSTHGDFATSVNRCAASDTAARSLVEADIPPYRTGFWYVVRAQNCAGAGSYDDTPGGQQGPRDPGIGASPQACP